MKKVYTVVGVLRGEVIVEEFKKLKDAIDFVRKKDIFQKLHIKRPNGTWVERDKIEYKKKEK